MHTFDVERAEGVQREYRNSVREVVRKVARQSENQPNELLLALEVFDALLLDAPVNLPSDH